MKPEESGSSSAGVEFGWISAQWAWNQNRTNNGLAQRLRITLTFMQPSDLGTKRRRKITFNLTDRMREFSDANAFQKRVKALALQEKAKWIGKSRLRQPPKGEPIEEIHKKNIPDLAMTARIDGDIICARLYSTTQTIDLRFDQKPTEAQAVYYEGCATWGCRPKNRVKDDFKDWLNYA